MLKSEWNGVWDLKQNRCMTVKIFKIMTAVWFTRLSSTTKSMKLLWGQLGVVAKVLGSQPIESHELQSHLECLLL